MVMVMTAKQMLEEIEKEETLRASRIAFNDFAAFCKQAWPHLLPGVPLK
jgi:hypothetical protein